MGKGNALTGIRAIAAVGLLVSALGWIATPSALAKDGGQGELQTAALAPADSLAFVSLNTDVSSEQWMLAADLLDQGGLEDLVYGTTAQLVDGVGLPAEWITPGSSLLGDEVSVVVVPGGDAGIDGYVVLSSANPNQAFETIRSRFLAETDDQFVLPAYEKNGVTVLSSGYGNTSLARVDDLIVFGTTTGVQQAIGVANGAEPALADQPAFADLVDELESDRIATAWANGPALTAAQGLLYGNNSFGGVSPQDAALVSPLLGQAGDVYSAVGVWAEREGFRLDARELPGPRADALTAPDDATDLADRAPADALLFLDGMDLGEVAVFRSYVDSIAFGFGTQAIYDDTSSTDTTDGSAPFVLPTIDESYAQLEKLLGFDVRADLLDQFAGDYGLIASSSSLDDAGDATAVLVSDVTDPATVKASADRLIALLRLSAGGDVTVNRIRLGGSDVTELLVPDMTAQGPLRMTIGVVDGQLLIGVGTGMEQYLDGPLRDPLADADRFKAAFDALPSDNGGRLYVDVHQLIDLDQLAALEPTMGLGDPIADPQLADLDGIQALAAVTRMDHETRVTSVVLTIDTAGTGGTGQATPRSSPDASPRPDASPAASPAAATAASLAKVTDVVPVDAGEARILGVSPADGAMLSYDSTANQVCIVSTAGKREACGGPLRSVDTLHVAWSPDGRRVAFSEASAINLVDGDIHVFDRDAGELQDWTDDGYDGGFAFFEGRDPGAPATIPVDSTPAWTPDGSAVVFARSSFRGSIGDATTILLRVDGPGADPARVAPVATFPFATYLGIGYAPDGRLLYTVSSGDPNAPETGLYELSADGKTVRKVVGPSEETGPPYLLGVTSAGSALVTYRELAAQYGSNAPGKPCTIDLIDLASARRTPMRLADGSCALFGGVSPDGGTVILFAGGPEGNRIAVVDPAAPGVEPIGVDIAADTAGIDSGGDPASLSGNDDLGLSITRDGRFLLRRHPGGGVLVRLG